MTSYEDWYNQQLPPYPNPYTKNINNLCSYPRSRYLEELKEIRQTKIPRDRFNSDEYRNK